MRKREWILSEESLEMDLINWLKAQRHVTTKITPVFVNTVLLARERTRTASEIRAGVTYLHVLFFSSFSFALIGAW